MARSFFKGLVTGLKNCHKKNIVHGDIKSDNCLHKGTLKLTDFDLHPSKQHRLQQFCGMYAYPALKKLE